jgi:hypothetical protein
MNSDQIPKLRVAVPLNEKVEDLFHDWLLEVERKYSLLLISDDASRPGLSNELSKVFRKAQILSIKTKHHAYAESFFGSFLNVTVPMWNLRVDADETVPMNDLEALEESLQSLDKRSGYLIETYWMSGVNIDCTGLYQERFKTGQLLDPKVRIFHSNYSWPITKVHTPGIITGRISNLPGFTVRILHWGLMFRPLETRKSNYLEYNRIAGYKNEAFSEGYDLSLECKENVLLLDPRDYAFVTDRLGYKCHI